jgi:hypothetical protein
MKMARGAMRTRAKRNVGWADAVASEGGDRGEADLPRSRKHETAKAKDGAGETRRWTSGRASTAL